MPLLVTATGRHRPEAVWWVRAAYAALGLGAFTMIYPFLVMISGSVKSDVDLRDWDVVPRYFASDTVLYRKYLESKYDESLTLYNSTARQEEFAFRLAAPPPVFPPARVNDWKAFLAEAKLPVTWTLLGHANSVNGRMYPRHARGFRAWMAGTCGGSIETFRRTYGSLVTSWLGVGFPAPLSPADRNYKLTGSPFQRAALEYHGRQPIDDLIVVSLDGRYVTDSLQLKYGKKIEDYNRAHGTRLGSWSEVTLSPAAPPGGRAREDWLEFVRGELNLQFVRVAPAARPAYASFLGARYGTVAALNRAYGASYRGFDAVPFPEDRLAVGRRLVDWELFVREVPARHLGVDGPDLRWRGWLEKKYASRLDALRRAHGADYASFAAVPIPAREAAWAEMRAHPGRLRLEFATRNYRHVLEYLLLHGRGLFNTAVFCALSILSVLIVNPVAAYAMSRYQLPSAYKVLLYLLATIAFPPMVTTIPNFLLLKQLGLLNTFAALILPGMVNGYAIFLLKGFFDSLPRELYDAAQIDGAGEWTMFWLLTMNLSKPILAVITLDAFNSAYGAFVYAFIVCQDERMWTLGVWLYQLQQYAHQSVTFAALLVASIPTFLVFLFAQRLILQGIVVPVEK